MLPYDRRPWAKSLARVVILISFLSISALTLVLYRMDQLHIPEGVGVVLLMLLFLPPNIAVLTRDEAHPETNSLEHRAHATSR